MRHTAVWAGINKGKREKGRKGLTGRPFDPSLCVISSAHSHSHSGVSTTNTRPINVLSPLGTSSSCPLSSSLNTQPCKSSIHVQISGFHIVSLSSLCSLDPLAFYRCVRFRVALSIIPSRFTEQAFGSGPDCLGIIIVRDLPPKYQVLRERLLKLSHAFAQLDESVRENYADAKSRYRFGSALTLIAG